MNIATIVITGLSLLVRPSAADKHFLNAFLIAKDASVSTDKKTPIPQHFAFVLFDMADLDTRFGRTTRKPDIVFTKDGVTYGVFLLKKEVITPDGDATDPLMFDGDTAGLGQGEERAAFKSGTVVQHDLLGLRSAESRRGGHHRRG